MSSALSNGYNMRLLPDRGSIVRFARSKGILCQGRGSAANSAVCFVLGVTPIDPVRQGLLFERFVSEERREPPDIDVDFEHERREEVIQWIYETYGRTRSTLTSTVTRYRARGAIREAGIRTRITKPGGLSLYALP
jgi:error-prone DNA polymerase